MSNLRGHLFILVFLFLSAKTSLAQFTYTLDSSVPVINGTQLSMPWAGGLNAAQFNTIDLNGDNLNDLAIFDRTSSRIITFIQIDIEDC